VGGCGPAAPRAGPAAPSGGQTSPAAAGACSAGQLGGTLVMGRGSDSEGFDPPGEASGESIKVLDNLYNGLVRASPGGDVAPDLASSWTVSPDGLTYTFTLRRDVKFHDGADFDAEAVKFSFERPFDKEDPAYFAGMAQATSFTFASMKSVEVADPYTVRIALKEPNVAFLNNLATGVAYVVSPAAVKKLGKDFRQNPVGTGPFKFVRWVRNQEIELVRNPDYFLKGCPHVEKVIFRVIPDNTVRLQELKTGAIQVADSLAPTDVQAIKADRALKLFEQPAPIVALMNFRLQKDPWKDLRVRQAVAHAIDKPALVKGLYGETAVPAYGPLLPGLVGFDPQFRSYPFDVAKAKQLLTAAGFPNGFETTLWIQSRPRNFNPVGVRLAEALQAALAAVNIRARVVAQEPATFNQAISDPNNNEVDLYVTGWWSDNGAQNYFINSYYLGGSPFNRNGYQNAQVDTLLRQADQTLDAKKRTDLYQEAQRVIVDDAPAVFLSYTLAMQGATAAVQGFRPPSFGAVYRFDDTWLQRR
jgi:peptide/nickel transport system substrate-binding protein